MAAPGISALMECWMLKFLLQTSTFLWLKHQSDYIQHFPAHYIQLRQTVQNFSEHLCSTASWYLVFTLVSWGIILFTPSFSCSLGRNRHSRPEPKYTQLNTPSFTMASNKNQSVQEQDKLIADPSLFPSPSLQCLSPCSADGLCLQKWPHSASQPVCQHFLWPGTGQQQISTTKWNWTLCRKCSSGISSNQTQQGFELRAPTAEGYEPFWAVLCCLEHWIQD